MTIPIDDYVTPTLWQEGWPDRLTMKEQDEFLFAIWVPQVQDHTETFGSLCFRKKGSSKMVQEFVQLADDMSVVGILRKYDRHKWDQFFSPNTFIEKNRLLSSVSQACWWGWCDVDAADPFSFKPAPSVVWQTSPRHTQALWFWDNPHTPDEAAAFSMALTKRHGGDSGGSAANKLLRLPGSFNHKPKYAKPFIPLLKCDLTPIEARPKLLRGQKIKKRAKVEERALNPYAHDRMDVWRKYRRKLDASASLLIRHNSVRASDRSGRIFAMVAGLFEAGASLDEIASVIWTSPYFREKHGDNVKRLEREIYTIIAKVGDAG